MAVRKFERYKSAKKSPESSSEKTWVGRAISISSALGWATAISVIFIMDYAKPKTDNIVMRFLNIPVRSSWNTEMLKVALAAITAVVLICGAGLAINLAYYKRRVDGFNRSVIMLGVLSVVAIVVFIVQFGYLL